MFVPRAAGQMDQQVEPAAVWFDQAEAEAGVWAVASGFATTQSVEAQEFQVEAQDLAGSEDPEQISAGLTWTAERTLPRNLSFVS